ncbi:MAG: cell wall hydrolase [Clostridiaceae bacterium]|nr:cell wall hydrolase [Clostridiaceae bacterium]
MSIKLSVCTLAVAAGITLFSMTSYAATLLKVEARGHEVSKLQQTLKDKGYFSHSVTGYYGSITKDAVIRFQQANGLVADGIVGPQTAGKLYANSSSLLKLGSRGPEVSNLQQSLKTKGYFNHEVTGYFGPVTRDAVLAFQRDNGLLVDGIVGNQTWTALNNQSAQSYSSSVSDDIYWLARIIEAEAGGEPYAGKVAVGNVVMNRLKSSLFPNTIKGVIFDSYKGIPAFSPVQDGTIYNTPSAASIEAAKAAYNGEKPVGNSTYFFNPAKSKGTWIVKNKKYVTKIGNHVFYA